MLAVSVAGRHHMSACFLASHPVQHDGCIRSTVDAVIGYLFVFTDEEEITKGRDHCDRHDQRSSDGGDVTHTKRAENASRKAL